MAKRSLKLLREILRWIWPFDSAAALACPAGEARPMYSRPYLADAAQPDIAYRTRAKLPTQSARSLRSLPRSLARATQSKDRREKTVEVGTPPTGCRDEPRSKAQPAQSPPLH